MRASTYISKAACRGYRPSKFASHMGRQRPHLIARLAKERATARFIVAPDGYGKTSLAIDYAETMFAWMHVFWLNAQSPCFIRDLDAACIAKACRRVDPEARLIVIDDLPQLDADRAQQLSHEIDELLSHGCEVVVSCVPSCNLLGGFQVDRVQIGARDLLLNDEEVDAVRTEEERVRLASMLVPAAGRVPVLAWNAQPAAVAAFVSGCLGEGLPADLLLAACSAFALQRGDLSEVAGMGPVDLQLVADALGDYPHLGFDVETGRFEAPVIDADVLARAAKGRIEAIVGRSRFESRDDLVRAWAETLLERGSSAERACDIVRAFCPVKRRAQWLVQHVDELARQGCFNATMRLVRSLKGGQFEGRERMLGIEALCRRMLGDDDGSIRCAKRCAFGTGFPQDVRAIGLLIVARLGSGELRKQATSALMEWAMPLLANPYEAMPWQNALVAAWGARQRGVDSLADTWKALHDSGVEDRTLCLVASWLFTCVCEIYAEGASYGSEALEEAERFVRARLTSEEAAPADFFAASAGLSMEEAHMKGMVYYGGPLEASILLSLRRVEMGMIVQRREFEQALRDEQVRRSNILPEGPLYGRRQAVVPAEQHAVPTLELKMFGRLDVFVGGIPLNPGVFARKQVRVLLTLLVANRGRDLSRDVVARSMWPTCDESNARKNFYATWSQLRRALTLPDGTCPYLVRHQYGCHLDESHVKSDLARLDDICRDLLFGQLYLDEWLDMYNELDRDFSGELMPTEEDNALVEKVRLERRTRLVDALVAASLRLIESGNAQWAIWFARLATERESTREDAYAALMRAQVAYDQRTAAMMTYLACRKALAEELGIDPSPEVTALYESLLNS